jgi:hypothetical protein
MSKLQKKGVIKSLDGRIMVKVKSLEEFLEE